MTVTDSMTKTEAQRLNEGFPKTSEIYFRSENGEHIGLESGAVIGLTDYGVLLKRPGMSIFVWSYANAIGLIAHGTLKIEN